MTAFTYTSVIVVIMMMVGVCNAKCCDKYLTMNNLQLITSYATWRNIKSVSIFNDNILSDCNLHRLKIVTQTFYKNNLFLSFRPFSHSIINFMGGRRIQIVVFEDSGKNLDNTSGSKQFSADDISKINWHNTESKAWLVLVVNQKSNIIDKLKFMSLSLSTDLTIAFHTSLTRPEVMGMINIITNQFKNNLKNYELIREIVLDKVEKNMTCIIADELLSLTSPSDTSPSIKSYYNDANLTSEVTHMLGLWTAPNGTDNLAEFQVIEKRTNFRKFPLKIGIKNTTKDALVIDDEGYEDNFDEFINYFKQFLNATDDISYFQKLGYKDDGEWTDLVRAVVNEDVDLGLHGVIKTPSRFYDMAFTHIVMKSIRNIYVKPQESYELRDIFSVPFGGRLIGCVFATGVVLSFIITLIGRFERGRERIGLGDGAIWCVGIFTLQGSTKTLNTCSGNIILLVSLAFALVIFNSYSAFITSILSVEVSRIQSVDDLLLSDYKIGYAKNSQDEIYLRNMNETQLQQIYLRGYLHNTVNNVTEGLMRSSHGNYGFFASSNTARKKLQYINNYKCSYDISEIPVDLSRSIVAFPLSKTSPYRRIINLSMVKMYETGVHKYVHSLLIPDLLLCETKRTFRSANLPDLTTAFAILILGIHISIIFLLVECLWFEKSKIYESMSNKWQLRHNTTSIEETPLHNSNNYSYTK